MKKKNLVIIAVAVVVVISVVLLAVNSNSTGSDLSGSTTSLSGSQNESSNNGVNVSDSTISSSENQNENSDNSVDVSDSTTSSSENQDDDSSNDEDIIDEPTVWDGNIADNFAGGVGSQASPYLIRTGAQLAFLANSINGNDNNNLYNKHYKLAKNIDLGGLEWDPIGCYYNSNGAGVATRTFQGVFDGNGYTIENFKITLPKLSYYQYFGLFGYVTNGSIKNLKVENSEINLSINKDVFVGSIIGYSKNENIDNCSASGKISVDENDVYLGGVIGYSEKATINNNSFDGSLSAETSRDKENFIGGLVGYCNGSLKDCSTEIEIKAITDYGVCRSGGLIGSGSGDSVINCSAKGSLQAKGYSTNGMIGGLMGFGGFSIEECSFEGNISCSGQKYLDIGGFAGYVNGKVIKSYTNATVESSATSLTVGGFVGTLIGRISSCFSNSKISGRGGPVYAGGFVGELSTNTINEDVVENSYSLGEMDITATAREPLWVGGFAGRAFAKIANCYTQSDIKVTHFASGNVRVGGLCGAMNNYNVENCIAAGDMEVNYNYNAYIGVICGSDGGKINSFGCYNQKIYLNETDYSSEVNTEYCELRQLNSKSFYTETLGWSDTIWDFRNLDFTNGKMPTIIA